MLKAFRSAPLLAAPSLLAIAAGMTVSGSVAAQALPASSQSQEIRLLKEQIDSLNKKLDALAASQARTEAAQRAQQPSPAVPAANTAAYAGVDTVAPKSSWTDNLPPRLKSLLEVLGEIDFYGSLDLSVDYATKGLASSYTLPDGTVVSPRGHMGWQPDISTNLSYFGLRGKRSLGSSKDLSFVYQFETQIDVSATSGTGNSNSAQDSTVKGALTSRNSYIGIASSKWGAFKVGKTDAPYKNSTAKLNPFSGTLGDYSAIMGNTGGD